MKRDRELRSDRSRRRAGRPGPNVVRRTSAEWVGRASAALVALAIGWFGVSFSLAQVTAKGNPALAHALAPYDGRITALRAASLAGASGADRKQADELARRALRQDPTAVVAASTLGLDAQIRGNVAAARRHFAYAQTLSRRDVQTQLWAIEDAVSRGDVGAALHHYDIALRTKPALAGTLFPVLTAASAEPPIRVALIRTLALRPQWAPEFMHYAAGNSASPQALISLFMGLRHAGVEIPTAASDFAINALIGSGKIDDAWRYYAAGHPGAADRRRSRDPGFEASPKTGSKLDWAVVDTIGINSTIDRGAFDFAAPASLEGPMLEQMQLLPPGYYLLKGRSSGLEQADGARPYWTLACTDGRQLGRIDLPASASAGGSFGGRFSVPAGCPVQMLTLVARASDAIAGQSGRIEMVQLVPAS